MNTLSAPVLYNEVMIWARKGLVHVLAFLLFVSLLGGALAFSTNTALSKPTRLEGWLKDSGLYSRFVDNAITQAQKSESKDTGTSGVSGHDEAVRLAAESTFSPQLLQSSVNTFIDSNYAWLQGKTTKPEFVIDLTQARQTFAEKVGKYAETRLATLPACTSLQQAQLINPNDIDALAVSCRPAGVTPAAAGAQVTQKILTSDDFLSKPVLTAETINPRDDKGGSQPYYTKLAKLPQAYRLGQKLPLIFSIMALVTTLGIVLIAPSRRRGVRRVGVMLLLAGAILVVTKFTADMVFTKVEDRVFNNSSVGQIQQSLLDFAQRVQHQIVGVNLYFGTFFLILAITIFVYLFQTRQQQGKDKPTQEPVTETAAPADTGAQTVQLAPRPRQQPALDVTAPKAKPTGPPLLKKPATPNTTKPNKPPRPRGPRLIQ